MFEITFIVIVSYIRIPAPYLLIYNDINVFILIAWFQFTFNFTAEDSTRRLFSSTDFNDFWGPREARGTDPHISCGWNGAKMEHWWNHTVCSELLLMAYIAISSQFCQAIVYA